SADSPRRLRRNSGGARPAGRPGRRARRRGDGEGIERIEGRRRGRRPVGARFRLGGGGLMFYWLYLAFASTHYVPVLNLLKYQTTRTGLAIFTAWLVVTLMGSRFIAWMKARQGKGQPIRAEGIE